MATGVWTNGLNAKQLLRVCNAIHCDEVDGLMYLRVVFDQLFADLRIAYGNYLSLVEQRELLYLREQREACLEGSQHRIDRVAKDGGARISDIATFRKVFEHRGGVTISTIHGIKGDMLITDFNYCDQLATLLY